MEDYKTIYQASGFPRKARPDTAYGLAFRVALWKAISLMAEPPNDWPLNIVMEEGHKNLGDALRIWSEVRDSLKMKYQPMLGYMSIGSKRGCLPLAIADSLCYALFRQAAGYSHRPGLPEAAAPVGPADPPYYVSKIPMSQTWIDQQSLENLRANVLVFGRSGLVMALAAQPFQTRDQALRGFHRRRSHAPSSRSAQIAPNIANTVAISELTHQGGLPPFRGEAGR
jgi:hypothetical protein